MRNRVLAAAVAAAAVLSGLVAVGVGAPAAHAAACVVPLGKGCGPYSYAGIPMSNGYDTYVSNQDVGANSGTVQTVTATDPGHWSVTANATPYGYTGVQTFPDVQQLTNDWCGTAWGGCASATNTPLSALSALKVNYAESSPRDANSIYEFAPDVWSNYPSDVMFWADTHGRCNTGAFGGTVLGPAVLAGQHWTVHRYGGPGAEIIFVLDGAGGPGTCAEQSSGTIDIKAGFDWLAAHGYVANPVISQLNTGWEITSADHTTFRMTKYSITATVGHSRRPPGGLLVGTRAVQPTVDSNTKGVAEAFQYVAARNGTSARITFYVDASNRATAGRLGVYSNHNGHPGKLLRQAWFKPSPGWHKVKLSGVPIVKGRHYWLAELGTMGRVAFRDRGTGGPYSETSFVGSKLPAKWSGGTRWYSGDASFYVSR